MPASLEFDVVVDANGQVQLHVHLPRHRDLPTAPRIVLDGGDRLERGPDEAIALRGLVFGDRLSMVSSDQVLVIETFGAGPASGIQYLAEVAVR